MSGPFRESSNGIDTVGLSLGPVAIGLHSFDRHQRFGLCVVFFWLQFAVYVGLPLEWPNMKRMGRGFRAGVGPVAVRMGVRV